MSWQQIFVGLLAVTVFGNQVQGRVLENGANRRSIRDVGEEGGQVSEHNDDAGGLNVDEDQAGHQINENTAVEAGSDHNDHDHGRHKGYGKHKGHVHHDDHHGSHEDHEDRGRHNHHGLHHDDCSCHHGDHHGHEGHHENHGHHHDSHENHGRHNGHHQNHGDHEDSHEEERIPAIKE